MVQFSSSPAGQRFLASIREGRGLKQSARDAGVHQEVGYRWLKERYLQLRRGGVGPAEAVVHMGFRSSKMEAWELEVDRSTRHHLRVREQVEDVFWGAFKSGASSTAAATAAGVSRSTAHRWLSRRYGQLRRSGASLRTCQRQLRLTGRLGLSFEQAYQQHRRACTQAATQAQREAIATSRRYGEHLTGAVLSDAQQARAERNRRYWQLMRSGTTNTEACRLLGMSRRTGGAIRRAANQQVPSLRPPH